jgi:hypothetical protein
MKKMIAASKNTSSVKLAPKPAAKSSLGTTKKQA